MGNMDKFRFRVQIYQINYKILVLLYYTLLEDEIYSRARLQVLATGWVSSTVLRERSLEGKTHVDRYKFFL